MADFQITHVNKGGSGVEHITEVGCRGPDGVNWRLSVSEVIASIRIRDRYYVADGRGNSAWVQPWPDASTGPHLRSNPDATKADNLTSLPPIPAAGFRRLA